MEPNPPADRSNPENGRLINIGRPNSCPGLNLTAKRHTNIIPVYRFPQKSADRPKRSCRTRTGHQTLKSDLKPQTPEINSKTSLPYTGIFKIKQGMHPYPRYSIPGHVARENTRNPIFKPFSIKTTKPYQIRAKPGAQHMQTSVSTRATQ